MLAHDLDPEKSCARSLKSMTLKERTASSADWNSSRWGELRDDSDSENHTLARVNSIEGKQLSERRVSKLSQVSAEDMNKLFYGESNASINWSNDDQGTEWVGYENLVTPMDTNERGGRLCNSFPILYCRHARIHRFRQR
jgi:hypothetical protein